MTDSADNRAAVAARTLTELARTDTGIAQFASSLTPQIRAALSTALEDAASADNDRALITAIKNVLATEAPGHEPTGVLFHTMAYAAGCFLVERGEVYFADGTTGHIDFGRDVELLLTAEFGARGERTTLLVDLRDDTIDVDDYDRDVRGTLGFCAEPDDHRKDGGAGPVPEHVDEEVHSG